MEGFVGGMSNSVKKPIILEGVGFDWEEGDKYSKHVEGKDGEVNWWAVFSVDPGVMKCPSCGICLWWEGRKVKCPDCGHVWEVKN